MKQPWAWVTWLVTVLVMLSITRNPLYLMIILLCIIFVGLALQKAGAELIRPFSLWKIAIWIIIFATAFNALTSHYGQTVLFTIPGRLPLIKRKRDPGSNCLWGNEWADINRYVGEFHGVEHGIARS